MSDERKLQPVQPHRDITAALRETFGTRNRDTDPDWLPFEEWENILKRAAVRDPKTGKIGFGGALGVALAARYEWLKESRRDGLTPAQAEARFSGRIDRERAELAKVESETARTRANIAAQSRGSGRRRGEEADL